METAHTIKLKLIEAGGRMSQDLGLGRIVGQILVYLYLQPRPCSLDDICDGLGLSKASSSIAARQLERLGMVLRVWKKGDRKSYYKIAENFIEALQQGLFEFFRQKLKIIGSVIEPASRALAEISQTEKTDEINFLSKRVHRALKLQSKVEKIVESPILKLLR